MAADWSEMRHLEGKQFLVDTPGPNRTWLETYIPPEDHLPVLAAIQEAIRHRRPFELEHRVIRADGTLGCACSRAIPLLSAQGKISEWIGAASDVTERRRADDALRQSETQSGASAPNIGVALEAITPQDAHQYFAARGYGVGQIKGNPL